MSRFLPRRTAHAAFRGGAPQRQPDPVVGWNGVSTVRLINVCGFPCGGLLPAGECEGFQHDPAAFLDVFLVYLDESYFTTEECM